MASVSSYDPSQYPGSSPQSSGTAAPGWYPVDHLSQRYWDGYEWTNHVAPLPAEVAAGQQGAQNDGMATSDQRTYALIMHLGSLFIGFLVPLVMWLVKKDESPFIDDHGKQLMNWHISLVIYFIISMVLILVISRSRPASQEAFTCSILSTTSLCCCSLRSMSCSSSLTISCSSL